ncbi:MAG: putative bifunctional diguanylate cyclase/phosphodiesterase, partial [Solirubrobacteraceae bacterium]
DMHEAVVRRVGLEADLHRAARRGQLLLDYQPILEVGTASLLGFEALVRWLHPERGLLPPGQFIPIAEESGAIVEIGRWVLREACAQLSRWQACGSGLGSTVMSVNLSVGQLQSPGLVGDVVEALAGAGLRASQLQLEVTETLLAAERSTVAALRSLDRVGVRLAIDDFGTGYASLSSLRSLPFKVLKVDRSFVAGIGSSQQDAAIVAATLGLGQALGLQTVAEGVETARQLEFLELHGCDAAQGYLLGKPQAPARLAGLLRTRQAPGRAEHAPEASTPGADPAITLPGPPDSGSPGPPGSGSGLQLLDDPVHHHSEEASGRAQ